MKPRRGIKIAAALKYDAKKDGAPRLLAKGKGLVAQKILERAQDGGIDVHEDAGMAGSLMQLDLGSEIPECLYEAVARILAHIIDIDNKEAGME